MIAKMIEALDSDGPNPVDIHVGSRVRYRRTIIRMSQEKLGERMGLSFQQIQKYEKGTNRISASGLFQLSKILEVPVGYFFEDDRGELGQTDPATIAETPAEKQLREFMRSPECIKLCQRFLSITVSSQRSRILTLMKALGNNHGIQNNDQEIQDAA